MNCRECEHTKCDPMPYPHIWCRHLDKAVEPGKPTCVCQHFAAGTAPDDCPANGVKLSAAPTTDETGTYEEKYIRFRALLMEVWEALGKPDCPDFAELPGKIHQQYLRSQMSATRMALGLPDLPFGEIPEQVAELRRKYETIRGMIDDALRECH